MSNQGGLKHVATEPTRLENKREGRRGGAGATGAPGRASVLRRAPSDSDCSGETASLSADSGDRAIRPAPQPPPRGKSRRRRGSEWEVLEGLKDGQRFEKRPEVFNGYLHKKRKWPLKGWHKRFFVVDGGILVYARSPTDVARGRLHGSVDVGLSVISAKARRRRIDIDADEFIYHLRAKTPDVFRTWLTVLKAHRLYRQHLLTFGARESVPKIHAPLEDLPPTDTSSRTTHSGIEISTLSSFQKIQNMTLPLTYIPSTKPLTLSCEFKTSVYDNKNQFTLNDWPCNKISSKLLPLKFDALNDSNFDLKSSVQEHEILSNNIIELFDESLKSSPDESGNNSPVFSLNTTDAEKQIHSTELELSLRSPGLQSSILCEYYINTPVYKDTAKTPVKESSALKENVIENPKKEGTLTLRNKAEPIATYCFSTHKTLQDPEQSPMKRSKKSTNLVKYRNMYSEPPLKKPFNTYMLLGNYSNKITKEITFNKKCDQSAFCNIVSHKSIELQAEVEDKKSKQVKDAVTTSDLDKITEKLMMSIFDKIETSQPTKSINVKSCINQVVKELYDSKTTHNDAHPVIALFKSLLEYWLKNTSVESVREAVRRVKSVDRQSNKYFTKDENTSSFYIENVNKQTQFHGMSDMNQNISRMLIDIINKKGKSNKARGPRVNNDSSEKERRIQEIERILKNTVYICGTAQSRNVEKDIKITKTLIDNLEKSPKRTFQDTSDDRNNIETSNSSSELPKIQDTLNRLISDTSLPLGIAKDFLNAYLDLLNDSKSSGSSSESTDNSKADSIPKCDVQTESIQRKASVGITTTEYIDGDSVKQNKLDVDPGQLYLKRILDNITTIFCKRNEEEKIVRNDKKTICNDRNFTSYVKDELGEANSKKSIVVDLSNYNLEHVSMTTNPDADEITSVTIKLKEKQINPQETNSSLLRLKFSDVSGKLLNDRKCNWIPLLSSKNSNKYFADKRNPLNLKIPFTYGPDICTKVDLKPYLTSSEATSKDYRLVNSDHSLNLGFQCTGFRHLSKSVKSLNCENDTQSCYVLASLKKCPFQSKKKNQSSDTSDKREPRSVTPTTTKDFCEEISMFENTPRTIDEKFILLLLENLTLLSKTMPAIHKEINALYVRLRKKYDKIIRNDTNVAPQGLGLLGKIYNDELNNKQVQDNETQYDNLGSSAYREVATETRDLTLNKRDESLTADLYEKQLDTDAQTEECNCKFCLKDLKQSCDDSVEQIYTSTTQTPTFSSTSERYTVPITAEKAISNQNWYRKICTKDCGIDTLMKYVLDTNDSSRNFRLKPRAENQLTLKFDKDSSTTKSLKTDKGHSNKARQDLIKEITLLSPSFKVSTQSQTERVGKNNLNKDFKVYELFTSKINEPKKSSSAFELNFENPGKSDDLKTIYRCSSENHFSSGLISPTGAVRTQAGFVSGTPGGRLASWIIESGGPLESVSRELGQAQLSVQQLRRLLDALELQQQTHHDTDVSLEGASPNVKKDRRKFGLRKKKSNNKCGSVDLAPPHIDPSASHMALSALTAPPSPGGGASSIPNSAASLPIACAATRPQSLPGAEALNAAGPTSLNSLTPDHQLREDFTVLAKDLVSSLKSILSTLVCERGRLRAAMDAADASPAPSGSMVAALRTNLSTALQQNSELRARLTRIHDASDLADISSVGRNSEGNRQFQQSLSYSSSCVSASEFFDAEEHDDEDLKPAEIIDADEAGVIELDGDSSSEAGSLSSEEGSASSDNSDAASIAVIPASTTPRSAPGAGWSRRAQLPAPRPTPGGPSLWNLLYKNIGKDLSQISMPVTINEPLNMLQRLCEELEYSELLDSAASCSNSLERMALVAAFAVSSYAAAAHRAASKPFNPLLAETYECVREDRGFRFLAEQVSHHPPISACHAESPRWCFWQEARIKTKFWGKSMEFQPAGRVHVRLLTTGDHYSWNKVTTCVHNLFGGQRWVDQYGDMHITCHGTDITCKLNFVKASSWSSSRHEVRGTVSGGGGRLRLQGRWSEALHAGDPPAARCLWRPGAMPPEHEAYYGFTRFAMELNELEPGLRDLLPHTDTRLRPDQRALEEGDVEAAEQLKHELEQAQRERRRDAAPHTPAWFRKAIEGGEETWVFTGEYWRARDAGFPHLPAPRLW